MIKRRNNVLEIPTDDALVRQALHNADKTERGIKRNETVSPCCNRVKNNRTYRSTATASRSIPRSGGTDRGAKRARAPAASLKSEVGFCPETLEPCVEFDLQKDNQTFLGEETNEEARARARRPGHHEERKREMGKRDARCWDD